MKIDTHVHTKNISICSRVDYKECIDAYKEKGYGAIIITNHYSKAYMEKYNIPYEEWIDKYIKEYYDAYEYGKTIGLKVLFGCEVTTKVGEYADYLLYGVNEKFLRENPKLYEYDQQGIYEICKKNNVLLFQAHPFRIEQDHTLQSLYYLDGLEINCNSHHTEISGNCKDIVLEIARIYDKKVTCGGDLHRPGDEGHCGMIVPDSICTSEDMRDYLIATPLKDLVFFGC